MVDLGSWPGFFLRTFQYLDFIAVQCGEDNISAWFVVKSSLTLRRKSRRKFSKFNENWLQRTDLTLKEFRILSASASFFHDRRRDSLLGPTSGPKTCPGNSLLFAPLHLLIKTASLDYVM